VKDTGIDFLKDCGCVTVTNSAINSRTCNTSTGCDASIGLADTGVVSIVGSAANCGVYITAANEGAVYAGDYENNFVARSLATAQYVTGLTSCGVTSASNGIEKVGANVSLGGALTGNTTIGSGASDFTINTANVRFSGATTVGGTLNLHSVGAGDTSDAILLLDSTGAVQCMASSSLDVTANNGLESVGNNVALGGTLTGNTTICLDTFDLSIGEVGGAYMIAQNTGGYDVNIGVFDTTTTFRNTGADFDEDSALIKAIDSTGATASKIELHTSGLLEVCGTAGFAGAQYDTAYKANFVCHSLVDVDYVTGITSGGITTANNGLYSTGQEVHLGGALTGNTTIDVGTDNQLSILAAKTAQGSSSIYVNEDNNLQFTVYTCLLYTSPSPRD